MKVFASPQYINPCPSCKSDEHMNVVYERFGYRVFCMACEITQRYDFDTLEKAINRWNLLFPITESED